MCRGTPHMLSEQWEKVEKPEPVAFNRTRKYEPLIELWSTSPWLYMYIQ